MEADIIKTLIIFIAGVMVGGYLPAYLRKDKGMLALKEPSMAAKQREKKESKKKIIMEYLTTLPESKITAEDVSRMFSVSRATGSKYLEELEEETKLKRVIVGDTTENSMVYYTKI